MLTWCISLALEVFTPGLRMLYMFCLSHGDLGDLVQQIFKPIPSCCSTRENMHTETFVDEKCWMMLFGGCSFRLMEQIKNRFQWSWMHKGHQKGNTSLNLSPALENVRDLKDIIMACNCVAPMDTSSLWVYLVIANNSLFTGQIVSSMVIVK